MYNKKLIVDMINILKNVKFLKDFILDIDYTIYKSFSLKKNLYLNFPKLIFDEFRYYIYF